MDIGLLLDTINPVTEELLPQMEHQIKAVVGEDAQVRFPVNARLINHFDVAQARINYRQLVNSDVDLIIAFGVVNNIYKQLNYHHHSFIGIVIYHSMVVVMEIIANQKAHHEIRHQYYAYSDPRF